MHLPIREKRILTLLSDPSHAQPRDHGGDLTVAMARYGGAADAWVDLSTGINPRPYPMEEVSRSAWLRLPDEGAVARTKAAARGAYGVPDAAEIVIAPGCSALIRSAPRLIPPAYVAIPAPTYNEHAAAFASEGWEVVDRPRPGVSAAVIVNPNNPDGRLWTHSELLMLADALDLLIIDESFMDPTPENSLMPLAGRENLVILRSFGKFYGLAGARLGFAITGSRTATRLAEMLGPWPVSGPALEIGERALTDDAWTIQTRPELSEAALRLATLAQGVGWGCVGGTALFQTFETPDADKAQHMLAEHRIWSRIFPYSKTWVRLGLPGRREDWLRLETALAACSPEH